MCLVLVKRPLTQALRSDEIDEGLVFESGLRNRRWRSNILRTAQRWRDGLRPRSSMSIDFSTLWVDEEFYIILSFKGHTYSLTKWNTRKGFIFWHSFSCLCIVCYVYCLFLSNRCILHFLSGRNSSTARETLLFSTFRS